MSTRINHGLANFGAELNDRLVHLRLDLLLEHDFAALENFVDVRPEFARLGVNNREFLLDSEGKCVLLQFSQVGTDLRAVRKIFRRLPAKDKFVGPL